MALVIRSQYWGAVLTGPPAHAPRPLHVHFRPSQSLLQVKLSPEALQGRLVSGLVPFDHLEGQPLPCVR